MQFRRRWASALLALTVATTGLWGSPAATADEREAQCANLIAGRHTVAGQVCFSNDDEHIQVAYRTAGSYLLTEVHHHLAQDLEGIPTNRSGNPVPGRFADKERFDEAYNAYIKLQLNGSGLGDDRLTGRVVLAAHATVIDDRGRTETAWCEGPRFVERGNWAMYCTFDVTEENRTPTPQ